MATAVRRIDPPLGEALVRWQHAAGPYWPYLCAVPFLADVHCRARIAPARPDRTAPISGLLADGLKQTDPRMHSAVFVDLPIESTLRQSEALRRLGFRVVPVVQRWIEERAVLPGLDLLQDLIRHQPRALQAPIDRGVVFLLDGRRAGPVGPMPASRFDNRYAYPVCRFPPASFFRAHGVSSGTWIADRGIAADLREYAESLIRGGLELAGCAP
jgi:hypothetical protein